MTECLKIYNFIFIICTPSYTMVYINAALTSRSSDYGKLRDLVTIQIMTKVDLSILFLKDCRWAHIRFEPRPNRTYIRIFYMVNTNLIVPICTESLRACFLNSTWLIWSIPDGKFQKWERERKITHSQKPVKKN